jgi:WD40 repeat protein
MSRARLLAVLLLSLTGIPAAVGAPIEGRPAADLHGDPLPPGAVARLGSIQLRHAAAQLVFSADGKTLISAGLDGEVRFWDLTTGRLRRRQRLEQEAQPRGRSGAVALAPDGDTVVRWRGSTLYVYGTARDELRRRLEVGRAVEARDAVLLRFAPDGKLLAVELQPSTGTSIAQLWDVMQGEKRPLPEFSSMLSDMAVSPSGKRGVAVAEGSLVLWDTTTAEVLESAPARGSIGVAFAPDGKTIAVSGDREVQLLDAATLKKRAVLEAPADVRDNHWLWPLDYSADGAWLVAGGEAGSVVWETAGRKKPHRFVDTRVVTLAIAPKGEMIANCDFGSEIHLWDVATGRRLHARPGHSNAPLYLAASADGKRLVSGSPHEANLLLWDAATGEFLHRLPDWQPTGSDCFFRPDGARLIAADETRIFRVWDTTTGEEVHTVHFQTPTANDPPAARRAVPRVPGWSRPGWNIGIQQAVAISSDGTRLSAICEKNDAAADDFRVCVWDVATGRLLSARPYHCERRTYSEPDGGGGSWLDVQAAFTPDGTAVTRLIGRTLDLEDSATGRVLVRFPPGTGRPLTFSPDGRLAAAALLQPKSDPVNGYDLKGFCLIEAATGQEILRIRTAEQSISGFLPYWPFVAFTPDGRAVVWADRTAIYLWDTATGKKLFQRSWPADMCTQQGWAIRSLAVLSSGRAATGMVDGTVLVWDLAPRTGRRERYSELDRKTLDALWTDLAGEASKAHRAAHILEQSPGQAGPFLRQRVQPTRAVDAKHIARLLADLDGDDFAVREAAAKELALLGERVEPALRRAIQGQLSLAARKRIETILQEPRATPPSDTLRTLRAIAVLERIGTAQPRDILRTLAEGAAEARETTEAKKSLQRLTTGESSRH